MLCSTCISRSPVPPSSKPHCSTTQWYAHGIGHSPQRTFRQRHLSTVGEFDRCDDQKIGTIPRRHHHHMLGATMLCGCYTLEPTHYTTRIPTHAKTTRRTFLFNQTHPLNRLEMRLLHFLLRRVIPMGDTLARNDRSPMLGHVMPDRRILWPILADMSGCEGREEE